MGRSGDGCMTRENQIAEITDRMNAMLSAHMNGQVPPQTEKERYFDYFVQCLAEFGVPVVNENHRYREPKAVFFDLIMEIHHKFSGV